jgi:hypothetical protein
MLFWRASSLRLWKPQIAVLRLLRSCSHCRQIRRTPCLLGRTTEARELYLTHIIERGAPAFNDSLGRFEESRPPPYLPTQAIGIF